MLTEEEILKIHELRREGKSYREIAKIIGTYSSNVTYIINPDQKVKYLIAKARHQKNNWQKYREYRKKSKSNWKTNFYISDKLRSAFRGRKDRTSKIPTYKDFFDKFGKKEYYTCYLTGELVHIKDISLDHIIPYSKDNNTGIENIGITSWKINNMKGSLSLDEFISNCKKIVHYQLGEAEQPST